MKDLDLEIPAGRIDNTTCVNKFGNTTNADSGITTDIWDRANVANNQAIWVAPTQARTHTIASTSANDTSGGTGANTVRIHGLTSWSASGETVEDVTMNTASPPVTSNSFVIIYRMRVLTKGATSTNEGTITATATTDASVTAQIEPGNGQTEMAIMGIPDTQTAYVTCMYGALLAATPNNAQANVTLRSNPEPDVELTNFNLKFRIGLMSSGSSETRHCFNPYYKLPGPALIKVQVAANQNNGDVSGGFDLIIEDN